ncbi:MULTISPECIES: hypothetical protein [Sphingopyxis]|jgi:hypothetical protein|nr:MULTISPECIES: hypothetical protein [Sphingopyxis]
MTKLEKWRFARNRPHDRKPDTRQKISQNRPESLAFSAAMG